MEQYCSASIPDIIRINSDAIVLEWRLEVSQMDLLGGEKHCRVREPNIGATSGGEGVDPQSAIKQAEHNSTLVSYCYVTVRTQALAPYLTPTSTASA